MSSPNRRNVILDAALTLLTSSGAQAVRLADVAHAAGVSRQAVYMHFGSRSQLFAAALARADETSGLRELAAPVHAAATGEEELAAFIALQAVHNPRIQGIARAIDEARRADPAAADAWAQPADARRSACLRIVSRLRREDALADEWEDDDAATALYILTSVRTWEEMVVDCGFSAERYRATVLALARGALLRTGRPTPPAARR